ncbi:MAG: endoribonuclease YicC domain-containing protein [Acetobacteraceae bacterium]
MRYNGAAVRNLYFTANAAHAATAADTDADVDCGAGRRCVAAAAIAAAAAELEPALRERLRARLAALLAPGQADDHRLLQEAAFAAERSDTSEELTRLEAHIAHFRALLAEGGEVGKRLDFLAQEMQREANTLLSKTSAGVPAALRITERGLALKAAIEKIREQVQNIE